MKTFLLAVCSFIALHSGAQEVTISKDVRKAMDRIDTNTIRSHIAFLADDKLKGRLPGTEGYQMAVDYVIDQYKKMGIAPGGDNGGYTQKLIIRKSIVDNSSVAAVLKDKYGNTDSLVFMKDFAPAPHPLSKTSAAEAPLIFAGYGVEIPGGYSDYAGVDVKGKIVVLVAGAPEGLQSTVTAHFSNGGNKQTVAFEKGAIGVIMYSPQNRPSTNANPTLQSNTTVNPERTQAFGRGFVGNLQVVINAATPLMKRLFMNSGKNMEQVLADIKKRKSFVI